jgi:transcription termination factor NusB
VKPAARRRARECAVQEIQNINIFYVLFRQELVFDISDVVLGQLPGVERQLSQNDIADVEYQFLAEQDVKDVDVLYFRELLSGLVATPDSSSRKYRTSTSFTSCSARNWYSTSAMSFFVRGIP